MIPVWVLTNEYNEYDQYGEYFISVYPCKPSTAQLIADGVPPPDTGHVLSGGGRRKNEDCWFHLREHRLEKHHD